MKKFILLLSVLALFPAIPCSAIALIKIEGKVISFTHEHYLIARNHQIFYIKHGAVSERRHAEFERPGANVEIMVELQDIELVKTEVASH